MRTFTSGIVWASALLVSATAQDANITLVPAATGFESDNAAFYYSSSPQLLANDGSAADGGFRVFKLANSSKLEQTTIQRSGRSKFAVPVYDVDDKDIIVNLPAPDSIMRVYDAESMNEMEDARKKVLGDWSSLCVWRSSTSGENYLFLFGKRKVVQFLIREGDDDAEILEVQTFPTAIEGETCAVFSNGLVYFSAEDQPLYSFQAAESTKAPEIRTVSEDIEVSGLAAYHAASQDYLFVAHDEVIDVYDDKFEQKGSIGLAGISDLSIEGGVAVLQSSADGYPEGAIAFAFEGEDDTGVALGSLKDTLPQLGIEVNTKYDPRDKPCDECQSPISDKCSNNGFVGDQEPCSCFVGFTGSDCSETICKNDCSGHGECVGPNTCQCESGWEGPDCSFVAVQAKYETDANGGDGDDPAIWVHPTNPADSKIVTTTKSEEGAGFAIFDLKGKMLQHVSAEQPNNVDVIYNFTAGSRKIDLAYAACRGDNTLCLFEITANGSLASIPGGIQVTKPDYEVYGSCTYTSAKTAKTYLFVNSKEALYLQYELSSTSNGTLQTTLVREFTGGSGGQVEGCVSDDAKGYLFLGEEPAGIWRYDAEPDGSSTGFQFAKVGDGNLEADVEGLSLVPQNDGDAGYIIVSSQGISSYLVYERAPPHAYVMTFTIVDNVTAGIDHVSNTDGIECVGNNLNADFPGGLCVTHDDANELAEGGTASQASFKFVSLRDVLGEERGGELGY